MLLDHLSIEEATHNARRSITALSTLLLFGCGHSEDRSERPRIVGPFPFSTEILDITSEERPEPLETVLPEQTSIVFHISHPRVPHGAKASLRLSAVSVPGLKARYLCYEGQIGAGGFSNSSISQSGEHLKAALSLRDIPDLERCLVRDGEKARWHPGTYRVQAFLGDASFGTVDFVVERPPAPGFVTDIAEMERHRAILVEATEYQVGVARRGRVLAKGHNLVVGGGDDRVSSPKAPKPTRSQAKGSSSRSRRERRSEDSLSHDTSRPRSVSPPCGTPSADKLVSPTLRTAR